VKQQQVGTALHTAFEVGAVRTTSVLEYVTQDIQQNLL